MTELFTVHTPPAAWARFVEHFQPPVRTERIATADALDRVLAEQLVAPQDLPEFARATVDGYAVAAADTFGATPGLPAFLDLAGEVPMGAAATFALDPGAAALVHTGGMIPPGADAVVMIEDTQRVAAGHIEVFRPVAEGQNVVQAGEDIRRGQAILAPAPSVTASCPTTAPRWRPSPPAPWRSATSSSFRRAARSASEIRD